ncbi:3-phosphoshikimate 1-carboxyvinyltransferase [Serinicoccus kebangsaanensis]|uniref:3-phosphoshikimate 1-carboxyvinyltransferase n=1 Tax=Serinicoccus kebangsaanensis TaxID=2602069 RepID=UPI00124D88C0|nr:3-phosphoshikimate 1-carboxyvinyltransferase [Serinicoccus kebangsaanensis]
MSTGPPSWWAAPAAPGPVDATVRIPGSKSLTNRWLVLALLADGPGSLTQPLRSRDSERMVAALRALGAEVDDTDAARWLIRPPTGGLRGGTDIDCGQAGTVMRFVPPVAALADGPVRFDGHPSARTRPVGPVLDGMRALGARVEEEGAGTLPFVVDGGVRGAAGPDVGSVPEVRIDASASSQFVSALLLAGAAYPRGMLLQHVGEVLPSVPHIEMTLDVLRTAGVRVDRPTPSSWRVHPGAVQAVDAVVEPDLSSAAPFVALAAATGGRVVVPGWPERTTQPGMRMREILAAMGARTELTERGLEAHGRADGSLDGVDLDLSEVGELTPVVAALCALATSPSRLSGIGHLRGHETDRLAALRTELERLGAGARERPDGLEVHPGPLHGARCRTYHDHRMAMFAAVVGSRVDGVEVEDVATADKTFPGFDAAWERAVATAVPSPVVR